MADNTLSEDAKKLISGDAELLSGDELARLAFLISMGKSYSGDELARRAFHLTMGTVVAFIVVVFVFIIL